MGSRELETTNEELQSSNEELETTNEELRSANEELATMNEEFLSQARQVEVSKQFLASILERIPIGLVVLDAQLDVLLWNRAVEDLFGVRSDEAIGRSFLALDIGLPVGALAPLLHSAVGDAPTDRRHLVLDAVDRRGRPFTCRAGVQRLDASGSGTGVLVLVDVSSEGASEGAS